MTRHVNVHVILFSIAIIIAAFSNMHLASVEQEQFSPWSYPRLDTIRFKVIKGSDAEVNALTVAHTVDVIPGPGTTPRINLVKAWGGNLSYSPSAAYGFITLQCRDVWPPEAAGGPEGKIPGQTCSPLNYSGFRVALSYIFGMDDKNASIFNYVQGPQTYGIKSIIPPAQAAWYDNTATLPNTDYAGAWARMQADGFWVDTDAKILYDVNNVPCRDLRIYSSSGISWQMELPDLVANFNDFMDNYLGVTNCNMALATKDFATLVYGDLMVYHDFDMAALGFTNLGPDPGWLISIFHSDYDVIGGWNFGGVHDPYMDHLMDIIRYSTDSNEIKQACYDFQHYFNGEMPESAIQFGATGRGQMPQFLWSSSMTVESYNPNLEDFVSSPCWGSLQFWTYCNLHWKDQPVGGTVRMALADEPACINPFYDRTLSGWKFLDTLCEPLVQYNPINLNIMPWLAKDYYYEGPINDTTPSGKKIVNGMKIGFYIREGIYWQDSGAYNDTNGNDRWDPGESKYNFPFTAYDCKFAADMTLKHSDTYCGGYCTTDLVEVSTEGPYEFTCWYNDSSSYWHLTYPPIFSMFPQHIYQKADKMANDGTLTRFSDFKPAFKSYKNWTGLHPPDAWGPPPTGEGKPGYWSALVGTGPYIFGYYNSSTLSGEVYKNTRYWAGKSPILQSLETCNEINGISHFKKEQVGSIITLETARLDLSSPEFSYWHETDPTPNDEWLIDGWKDLDNNRLLNIDDEVTLSKDLFGNGQWQGQGEFQIESLTWDAANNKWTVQVRELDYTPEVAQTSIVLGWGNLIWERPATGTLSVDVYYEAFCDAQKIASGWITSVEPFDENVLCTPITGWNTIAPCKHAFRVDFYVRSAGSAADPEYVCNVTRIFAYLPGDANGDGIVNMADIYTYGVENFLVDKTSYAWCNDHDESKSRPGSYPPSKYADVNGDGIVNMIDIYRMVIMYMKKADP